MSFCSRAAEACAIRSFGPVDGTWAVALVNEPIKQNAMMSTRKTYHSGCSGHRATRVPPLGHKLASTINTAWPNPTFCPLSYHLTERGKMGPDRPRARQLLARGH